MDVASGTAILRAFDAARKKLEREGKDAVEESAGFQVRGPQGRQVGMQVFVKVCRWSEELAHDRPETKGLTMHRGAQ